MAKCVVLVVITIFVCLSKARKNRDNDVYPSIEFSPLTNDPTFKKSEKHNSMISNEADLGPEEYENDKSDVIEKSNQYTEKRINYFVDDSNTTRESIVTNSTGIYDATDGDHVRPDNITTNLTTSSNSPIVDDNTTSLDHEYRRDDITQKVWFENNWESCPDNVPYLFALKSDPLKAPTNIIYKRSSRLHDIVYSGDTNEAYDRSQDFRRYDTDIDSVVHEEFDDDDEILLSSVQTDKGEDLDEYCEDSPCFENGTLCKIMSGKIVSRCSDDLVIYSPRIKQIDSILNTINSMRNSVARGTSRLYPDLPTAANMEQMLYDGKLENMATTWLSQCWPGPSPCDSSDGMRSQQLECSISGKMCSFHECGKKHKCAPDTLCSFSPIVICLYHWFRSAEANLTSNHVERGLLNIYNYKTAQLLYDKTKYMGCAYTTYRETGDTRVLCYFSPGINFNIQTQHYCAIIIDEPVYDKEDPSDIEDLMKQRLESEISGYSDDELLLHKESNDALAQENEKKSIKKTLNIMPRVHKSHNPKKSINFVDLNMENKPRIVSYGSLTSERNNGNLFKKIFVPKFSLIKKIVRSDKAKNQYKDTKISESEIDSSIENDLNVYRAYLSKRKLEKWSEDKMHEVVQNKNHYNNSIRPTDFSHWFASRTQRNLDSNMDPILSLDNLQDVLNLNRSIVAVFSRLCTRYTAWNLDSSEDDDSPIYESGSPAVGCNYVSLKFDALCYDFSADADSNYRLLAVLAPTFLFTLILYDLFSGSVNTDYE